jgi:uncharacterized membrane protein YfcA
VTVFSFLARLLSPRFMHATFGIWVIVLGLLGTASLVIARRPDAEALFDKVAPYQGWFGACSVVYGLWDVVTAALNLPMTAAGSVWLVWWILWLSAGLLQVSLGMLLGVGVMKTFVKDDASHARLDGTIVRLAPHQGRLGIAAICVGVAYTVFTVVAPRAG